MKDRRGTYVLQSHNFIEIFVPMTFYVTYLQKYTFDLLCSLKHGALRYYGLRVFNL
jgi:hypothetical protein